MKNIKIGIKDSPKEEKCTRSRLPVFKHNHQSISKEQDNVTAVKKRGIDIISKEFKQTAAEVLREDTEVTEKVQYSKQSVKINAHTCETITSQGIRTGEHDIVEAATLLETKKDAQHQHACSGERTEIKLQSKPTVERYIILESGIRDAKLLLKPISNETKNSISKSKVNKTALLGNENEDIKSNNLSSATKFDCKEERLDGTPKQVGFLDKNITSTDSMNSEEQPAFERKRFHSSKNRTPKVTQVIYDLPKRSPHLQSCAGDNSTKKSLASFENSDKINSLLDACEKEMKPIKDGIHNLRSRIKELNLPDRKETICNYPNIHYNHPHFPRFNGRRGVRRPCFSETSTSSQETWSSYDSVGQQAKRCYSSGLEDGFEASKYIRPIDETILWEEACMRDYGNRMNINVTEERNVSYLGDDDMNECDTDQQLRIVLQNYIRKNKSKYLNLLKSDHKSVNIIFERKRPKISKNGKIGKSFDREIPLLINEIARNKMFLDTIKTLINKHDIHGTKEDDQSLYGEILNRLENDIPQITTNFVCSDMNSVNKENHIQKTVKHNEENKIGCTCRFGSWKDTKESFPNDISFSDSFSNLTNVNNTKIRYKDVYNKTGKCDECRGKNLNNSYSRKKDFHYLTGRENRETPPNRDYKCDHCMKLKNNIAVDNNDFRRNEVPNIQTAEMHQCTFHDAGNYNCTLISEDYKNVGECRCRMQGVTHHNSSGKLLRNNPHNDRSVNRFDAYSREVPDSSKHELHLSRLRDYMFEDKCSCQKEILRKDIINDPQYNYKKCQCMNTEPLTPHRVQPRSFWKRDELSPDCLDFSTKEQSEMPSFLRHQETITTEDTPYAQHDVIKRTKDQISNTKENNAIIFVKDDSARPRQLKEEVSNESLIEHDIEENPIGNIQKPKRRTSMSSEVKFAPDTFTKKRPSIESNDALDIDNLSRTIKSHELLSYYGKMPKNKANMHSRYYNTAYKDDVTSSKTEQYNDIMSIVSESSLDDDEQTMSREPSSPMIKHRSIPSIQSLDEDDSPLKIDDETEDDLTKEKLFSNDDSSKLVPEAKTENIEQSFIKGNNSKTKKTALNCNNSRCPKVDRHDVTVLDNSQLLERTIEELPSNIVGKTLRKILIRMLHEFHEQSCKCRHGDKKLLDFRNDTQQRNLKNYSDRNDYVTGLPEKLESSCKNMKATDSNDEDEEDSKTTNRETAENISKQTTCGGSNVNTEYLFNNTCAFGIPNHSERMNAFKIEKCLCLDEISGNQEIDMNSQDLQILTCFCGDSAEGKHFTAASSGISKSCETAKLEHDLCLESEYNVNACVNNITSSCFSQFTKNENRKTCEYIQDDKKPFLCDCCQNYTSSQVKCADIAFREKQLLEAFTKVEHILTKDEISVICAGLEKIRQILINQSSNSEAEYETKTDINCLEPCSNPMEFPTEEPLFCDCPGGGNKHIASPESIDAQEIVTYSCFYNDLNEEHSAKVENDSISGECGDAHQVIVTDRLRRFDRNENPSPNNEGDENVITTSSIDANDNRVSKKVSIKEMPNSTPRSLESKDISYMEDNSNLITQHSNSSSASTSSDIDEFLNKKAFLLRYKEGQRSDSTISLPRTVKSMSHESEYVIPGKQKQKPLLIESVECFQSNSGEEKVKNKKTEAKLCQKNCLGISQSQVLSIQPEIAELRVQAVQTKKSYLKEVLKISTHIRAETLESLEVVNLFDGKVSCAMRGEDTSSLQESVDTEDQISSSGAEERSEKITKNNLSKERQMQCECSLSNSAEREETDSELEFNNHEVDKKGYRKLNNTKLVFDSNRKSNKCDRLWINNMDENLRSKDIQGNEKISYSSIATREKNNKYSNSLKTIYLDNGNKTRELESSIMDEHFKKNWIQKQSGETCPDGSATDSSVGRLRNKFAEQGTINLNKNKFQAKKRIPRESQEKREHVNILNKLQSSKKCTCLYQPCVNFNLQNINFTDGLNYKPTVKDSDVNSELSINLEGCSKSQSVIDSKPDVTVKYNKTQQSENREMLTKPNEVLDPNAIKDEFELSRVENLSIDPNVVELQVQAVQTSNCSPEHVSIAAVGLVQTLISNPGDECKLICKEFMKQTKPMLELYDPNKASAMQEYIANFCVCQYGNKGDRFSKLPNNAGKIISNGNENVYTGNNKDKKKCNLETKSTSVVEDFLGRIDPNSNKCKKLFDYEKQREWSSCLKTNSDIEFENNVSKTKQVDFPHNKIEQTTCTGNVSMLQTKSESSICLERTEKKSCLGEQEEYNQKLKNATKDKKIGNDSASTFEKHFAISPPQTFSIEPRKIEYKVQGVQAGKSCLPEITTQTLNSDDRITTFVVLDPITEALKEYNRICNYFKEMKEKNDGSIKKYNTVSDHGFEEEKEKLSELTNNTCTNVNKANADEDCFCPWSLDHKQTLRAGSNAEVLIHPTHSECEQNVKETYTLFNNFNLAPDNALEVKEPVLCSQKCSYDCFDDMLDQTENPKNIKKHKYISLALEKFKPKNKNNETVYSEHNISNISILSVKSISLHAAVGLGSKNENVLGVESKEENENQSKIDQRDSLATKQMQICYIANPKTEESESEEFENEIGNIASYKNNINYAENEKLYDSSSLMNCNNVKQQALHLNTDNNVAYDKENFQDVDGKGKAPNIVLCNDVCKGNQFDGIQCKFNLFENKCSLNKTYLDEENLKSIRKRGSDSDIIDGEIKRVPLKQCDEQETRSEETNKAIQTKKVCSWDNYCQVFHYTTDTPDNTLEHSNILMEKSCLKPIQNNTAETQTVSTLVFCKMCNQEILRQDNPEEKENGASTTSAISDSTSSKNKTVTQCFTNEAQIDNISVHADTSRFKDEPIDMPFQTTKIEEGRVADIRFKTLSEKHGVSGGIKVGSEMNTKVIVSGKELTNYIIDYEDIDENQNKLEQQQKLNAQVTSRTNQNVQIMEPEDKTSQYTASVNNGSDSNLNVSEDEYPKPSLMCCSEKVTNYNNEHKQASSTVEQKSSINSGKSEDKIGKRKPEDVTSTIGNQHGPNSNQCCTWPKNLEGALKHLKVLYQNSELNDQNKLDMKAQDDLVDDKNKYHSNSSNNNCLNNSSCLAQLFEFLLDFLYNKSEKQTNDDPSQNGLDCERNIKVVTQKSEQHNETGLNCNCSDSRNKEVGCGIQKNNVEGFFKIPEGEEAKINCIKCLFRHLIEDSERNAFYMSRIEENEKKQCINCCIRELISHKNKPCEVCSTFVPGMEEEIAKHEVPRCLWEKTGDNCRCTIKSANSSKFPENTVEKKKMNNDYSKNLKLEQSLTAVFIESRDLPLPTKGINVSREPQPNEYQTDTSTQYGSKEYISPKNVFDQHIIQEIESDDKISKEVEINSLPYRIPELPKDDNKEFDKFETIYSWFRELDKNRCTCLSQKSKTANAEDRRQSAMSRKGVRRGTSVMYEDLFMKKANAMEELDSNEALDRSTHETNMNNLRSINRKATSVEYEDLKRMRDKIARGKQDFGSNDSIKENLSELSDAMSRKEMHEENLDKPITEKMSNTYPSSNLDYDMWETDIDNSNGTALEQNTNKTSLFKSLRKNTSVEYEVLHKRRNELEKTRQGFGSNVSLKGSGATSKLEEEISGSDSNDPVIEKVDDTYPDRRAASLEFEDSSIKKVEASKEGTTPYRSNSRKDTSAEYEDLFRKKNEVAKTRAEFGSDESLKGSISESNIFNMSKNDDKGTITTTYGEANGMCECYMKESNDKNFPPKLINLNRRATSVEYERLKRKKDEVARTRLEFGSDVSLKGSSNESSQEVYKNVEKGTDKVTKKGTSTTEKLHFAALLVEAQNLQDSLNEDITSNNNFEILTEDDDTIVNNITENKIFDPIEDSLETKGDCCRHCPLEEKSRVILEEIRKRIEYLIIATNNVQGAAISNDGTSKLEKHIIQSGLSTENTEKNKSFTEGYEDAKSLPINDPTRRSSKSSALELNTKVKQVENNDSTVNCLNKNCKEFQQEINTFKNNVLIDDPKEIKKDKNFQSNCIELISAEENTLSKTPTNEYSVGCSDRNLDTTYKVEELPESTKRGNIQCQKETELSSHEIKYSCADCNYNVGQNNCSSQCGNDDTGIVSYKKCSNDICHEYKSQQEQKRSKNPEIKNHSVCGSKCKQDRKLTNHLRKKPSQLSQGYGSTSNISNMTFFANETSEGSSRMHNMDNQTQFQTYKNKDQPAESQRFKRTGKKGNIIVIKFTDDEEFGLDIISDDDVVTKNYDRQNRNAQKIKNYFEENDTGGKSYNQNDNYKEQKKRNISKPSRDIITKLLESGKLCDKGCEGACKRESLNVIDSGRSSIGMHTHSKCEHDDETSINQDKNYVEVKNCNNNICFNENETKIKTTSTIKFGTPKYLQREQDINSIEASQTDKIFCFEPIGSTINKSETFPCTSREAYDATNTYTSSLQESDLCEQSTKYLTVSPSNKDSSQSSSQNVILEVQEYVPSVKAEESKQTKPVQQSKIPVLIKQNQTKETCSVLSLISTKILKELKEDYSNRFTDETKKPKEVACTDSCAGNEDNEEEESYKDSPRDECLSRCPNIDTSEQVNADVNDEEFRRSDTLMVYNDELECIKVNTACSPVHSAELLKSNKVKCVDKCSSGLIIRKIPKAIKSLIKREDKCNSSCSIPRRHKENSVIQNFGVSVNYFKDQRSTDENPKSTFKYIHDHMCKKDSKQYFEKYIKYIENRECGHNNKKTKSKLQLKRYKIIRPRKDMILRDKQSQCSPCTSLDFTSISTKSFLGCADQYAKNDIPSNDRTCNNLDHSSDLNEEMHSCNCYFEVVKEGTMSLSDNPCSPCNSFKEFAKTGCGCEDQCSINESNTKNSSSLNNTSNKSDNRNDVLCKDQCSSSCSFVQLDIQNAYCKDRQCSPISSFTESVNCNRNDYGCLNRNVNSYRKDQLNEKPRTMECKGKGCSDKIDVIFYDNKCTPNSFIDLEFGQNNSQNKTFFENYPSFLNGGCSSSKSKGKNPKKPCRNSIDNISRRAREIKSCKGAHCQEMSQDNVDGDMFSMDSDILKDIDEVLVGIMQRTCENFKNKSRNRTRIPRMEIRDSNSAHSSSMDKPTSKNVSKTEDRKRRMQGHTGCKKFKDSDNEHETTVENSKKQQCIGNCSSFAGYEAHEQVASGFKANSYPCMSKKDCDDGRTEKSDSSASFFSLQDEAPCKQKSKIPRLIRKCKN